MRAVEIDSKSIYTYWKMFIKLTVSIYSFEVLAGWWSIGAYSWAFFAFVAWFRGFLKNFVPSNSQLQLNDKKPQYIRELK